MRRKKKNRDLFCFFQSSFKFILELDFRVQLQFLFKQHCPSRHAEDLIDPENPAAGFADGL